MKFFTLPLSLLILILTTNCVSNRVSDINLASISIVDANGTSEIISNEERLRQFKDVNFLVSQPYKKVLRVFKRDVSGSIHATITTYHANGELKQYLDVVNGRASGEYGVWHENGVRKIQAEVIGGVGDLYEGVENSWIFEGSTYAFSDEGVLEAEIPYVKGKREGLALYYHKNSTIWKQIPLHNDLIEGSSISYYDDGSLFEKFIYVKGRKDGPAERRWKGGAEAAIELYEDDHLITGDYFSPIGEPVSQIINGNGFRAIFSQDGVHELQQYRHGVQEGLIQAFGKKGVLCRTYGMKDGLKHGEEIEFNPYTGLPTLSITWFKDKVQGLAKSWYSSGQLESQREMADNKRTGLLSAWYVDGSLMLLENYEQDLLTKGEYFKRGDSFPVSSVFNGEGTATIYDNSGVFVRKINYHCGKPEE